LTMPCCLIAGDLDDNSPARVMRKMADKLPNAEFHIIESAGHLVNSEKPDLVNSVLCDFFDQVKNYSYKGEQSNECVKPLLLYWDLQHLISIQEKCFFELNLEYEMTPKYLVQLVC
ncbi:alpha/beta hydrolase, partial [Planktomarina sp.]|nr:alpha/beta hydrolase [Planktomarina sp.]